jgi:hypothetical protein
MRAAWEMWISQLIRHIDGQAGMVAPEETSE